MSDKIHTFYNHLIKIGPRWQEVEILLGHGIKMVAKIEIDLPFARVGKIFTPNQNNSILWADSRFVCASKKLERFLHLNCDTPESDYPEVIKSFYSYSRKRNSLTKFLEKNGWLDLKYKSSFYDRKGKLKSYEEFAAIIRAALKKS